MMRKLGLAAALAVLPLVGQAATIDLEDFGYERGEPVVQSVGATVALTELDPGVFFLDAFGVSLGLTLSANSLDFNEPGFAAFSLFGPASFDELSGSVATALGDNGDDLVQFLFEGVVGEGLYTPFNGGAVLVEVKASGLLPFPTDFSTDEGIITFTVLKEIAVIPLPAGLPLMLVSLGALAVLRRRQKA